ncbi:MAG: autoinducer binding domain-containing protein [Roseovarius sp.]|nr:autoinducer binding domain-containing protein [Roseovarius sp.]
MTQPPLEPLLTILLRLEQAVSLDEVSQIICDTCRPHRYDRVLLFSASAQQDGIVSRIYWSKGDWFGDGSPVDAETYFQRCPITLNVLKSSEPFFWSKTQGGGYRVVRRPSPTGPSGFQVPIYGPIGLEGVVSFGGDRIDAAPQVQLMLTLLATQAFKVTRVLVEGARPAAGHLSAREREVLAWVAAGRRQAEIAGTLGISERTVENHLRNARARLGVKTTAQAVQAAIRLGELDGLPD